MYAMLGSQPDICFAVNRLTQYGSNPSCTHLNSALHILWYLRATEDHWLTYRHNDCRKLIAYSDSDLGSDKDNHCSMTRFCFMFTGPAIAWATQKQCTVALSTMEAEYIALTACTKHVKWIISVWEQLDFDVDLPLNIFTDLEVVKAIAENLKDHDHMKHIDIQHHYIWECISDGTLAVLPVDSNDNTSDIFMKPFPCDQHVFLTKKLVLLVTQSWGSVVKIQMLGHQPRRYRLCGHQGLAMGCHWQLLWSHLFFWFSINTYYVYDKCSDLLWHLSRIVPVHSTALTIVHWNDLICTLISFDPKGAYWLTSGFVLGGEGVRYSDST